MILLQVWDKSTSGYFFWTLKKDEGWDAGWNFKNACQAEIIPGYLGSRAKSANVGADVMNRAADQAFGSHAGYWDGASKGKQMEHGRFKEGFITGVSDHHTSLSNQTKRH